VPGVASQEAFAAFFSNYAPLTAGGLGALLTHTGRSSSRVASCVKLMRRRTARQKTGFLFAAFTDVFERFKAASWLETHRLFALINEAAITLGLLPKNLPALLTDSVNVMPVATPLYDDGGARVSGAVTTWVADMRRRAEAGEPAASLVLCVWGAILSMIILGVFMASGIEPDDRAEVAGMVIILQTSDTRDALKQMQDLGVLHVPGFSVENASVVVAPEVTSAGYSPANMVGTAGEALVRTEQAYVSLFDLLRSVWVENNPLPSGESLPEQLQHALTGRVTMDVEAPVHSAEGLLAHNFNRGGAGMAIALQGIALLRATTGMNGGDMAQFLRDHGVDPLVPTPAELAAATEHDVDALTLADEEEEDEYSSEEEEGEEGKGEGDEDFEEEDSEGDDSDYT